MKRLIRKVAVWVSLAVVFCFIPGELINPGFLGAEEEKLTITSYYPSPNGSYFEILTTNNTYLAVTSGNVGIGTSSPVGLLQVGTSVAPPLLVTIAGNVGIGTGPGYRLHINGELYVNGEITSINSPKKYESNPVRNPANGTNITLTLVRAVDNKPCQAVMYQGIVVSTNCGYHLEP